MNQEEITRLVAEQVASQTKPLADMVKSLRAQNEKLAKESIWLEEENRKLREAHAVGVGGSGRPSTMGSRLSRNEMLPMKLEASSLSEIVEEIAEMRGLSPEDFLKQGKPNAEKTPVARFEDE